MKKFLFFTLILSLITSTAQGAILEIAENIVNNVSKFSAHCIARSMGAGGYMGAHIGMRSAFIGTTLGALLPAAIALKLAVAGCTMQPLKAENPKMERIKQLGCLLIAYSIALGFKYLIDEAEFF